MVAFDFSSPRRVVMYASIARKAMSIARQSPKCSLRGLTWDRTEPKDLTLRTL